MRGVARFFFLHIGSFVPVFLYLYLCGTAAFSADGVRHALLVALVVDSAYIALAWSQGEAKQFDCRRSSVRNPKETKGQDYDATTEAGSCCGPDGCC